jgi:integrase
LETEIDYLDDCLAMGGPVNDDQREGEHLVYSDLFDEVSEAMIGRNFRKVEKEADALLASAGLPPLDHESAEFGRLCRRLLEAKLEYLKLADARVDGNYEPLPRLQGEIALPGSTTARLSMPAAAAATGPTFREAVTLYFKENARAKRTDAQIGAELDRFLESIGGDKPIGSITKAECRRYKEEMLDGRKLGPATVIKHLSNLGGIFKWSSAQGFIPLGEGSNPCQGLAPSKKQAKKVAKERRPFTDAELVHVFGSPEYRKQKDKNPARYWLPLLCLFSVCRREEAGQLAVCDVQEEAGVAFLRINDDPKLGQSLKNDGSRRRVPIHSALVMLGFLQYVERIKKAGHVRLFPELTRGANGYSDPVGKWFGRLLRSVGINDPAVVLHSTRHTGISRLTGAGVPQDIREILAGHAAAGVHGQVYVHRADLPLRLLRDNLEKLDYSAVVKALVV